MQSITNTTFPKKKKIFTKHDILVKQVKLFNCMNPENRKLLDQNKKNGAINN